MFKLIKVTHDVRRRHKKWLLQRDTRKREYLNLIYPIVQSEIQAVSLNLGYAQMLLLK